LVAVACSADGPERQIPRGSAPEGAEASTPRDETDAASTADAASAQRDAWAVPAGDLEPRVPAPRPAPVEGAGEAGDAALVLAVRSFLLGDVDWRGNADPNGWTEYSFDLDGLASTRETENHCGTSGTAYREDGPRGLDNAFAGHFSWVLHNFTQSSAISAQSNLAVAEGARTLLLRFENLADRGAQSQVAVRAHNAGRMAASPSFDGSDVWPVREGSDAHYVGYVADDVFVSDATTQPLEITLQGYPLTLLVQRAVLSLDLRSLRAGGGLVYGVLTGVLGVEATSEAIRQLALEVFRTCNEGAVASVVAGVGHYSDIRQDLSNGDPGVPCDGVSIGIGFIATRAELGEGVPALAERAACSEGEPVRSEGVLAGTCEAVPPYEHAVSCVRVERTAEIPEDRVAAPSCSEHRPRGPVCHGRWVGESTYNDERIACSCHEECDAGRNGRCYVYGYECSYDDCFTDDDCGASHVCLCAGGSSGAHICVPANCRTNADCEGGQSCSVTRPETCSNLGGVAGYYCRTASDGCRSDADCNASGAGFCVYQGQTARWDCSYQHCTTP
jgi:hypothetical protein